MKEKIEELERLLDTALPPDKYDDGCYGTDGSHEALMDVFMLAYDRACVVATNAIKILKQCEKDFHGHHKF